MWYLYPPDVTSVPPVPVPLVPVVTIRGVVAVVLTTKLDEAVNVW